MSTNYLLKQIDEQELAICLLFNRFSRHYLIEVFFKIVSRLGNGVFWYSMILVLPVVYGQSAIPVSLQLTVTGLINLAIYKRLKHRLTRNRPYINHQSIQRQATPLDEYSFPSGHTLHAVAFTWITCVYYPQLGWLLIPFTILIALSRIILGLHYPSDVIAGAVIGASMAVLSFQILLRFV